MAAARLSVFFDASALMAAAGSPSGGSSVLLHLCGSLLAGHVSGPVLLEAEGNIHEKLAVAAWERWEYLLLTTPLTVVDVPANATRYADAVTAKDAHVYAAALAAQLPYLITLDQPLHRRVNALHSAVRAVFPGELIRDVRRQR